MQLRPPWFGFDVWTSVAERRSRRIDVEEEIETLAPHSRLSSTVTMLRTNNASFRMILIQGVTFPHATQMSVTLECKHQKMCDHFCLQNTRNCFTHLPHLDDLALMNEHGWVNTRGKRKKWMKQSLHSFLYASHQHCFTATACASMRGRRWLNEADETEQRLLGASE